MATVANVINQQQPKTTKNRTLGRRMLGVAVGLSLIATVGVGCSSSGNSIAASDTTVAASGGTSGGCTDVTNGAVTVVTKQFDFNPPCMTLTGDRLKVTYDNQEKGVKHNFDLKNAKAASGSSATELKAGPNVQTITYVDLKPGTYTYVCDIHANMKGTLTVKAS